MVPFWSWPDGDKQQQQFDVVHRMPVIKKLKRYEHSYVTRGFPVNKQYVTLAGFGIAVAKVSMKKFLEVCVLRNVMLVAEASTGGQADMQAVQLGSGFLAETKACPNLCVFIGVLPVFVGTAAALREGAHEERRQKYALMGGVCEVVHGQVVQLHGAERV